MSHKGAKHHIMYYTMQEGGKCMYRRCNNWNCCNKCNNSKCDDDMMTENMAEGLENICNNYANLSAYDEDDDSCECGFNGSMSVFPENATLAQSYVPIQYLNQTFKPCLGLKHGTIFPELVSPYKPCQSIEEIEFIKAMNKIGKGCNR